ncbi:MAG: anthranilate phosphoribosyltransferase [Deltaproteobacteria bacterium]|jgi:anthranilate phosphoribosyltransferase|nr:anthranilate phosphoribosyltransferase [Deltaproteobacteria bacterium]
MIKEAIAKAVNGQDLMEEEMVSTMNEIMTGQATSSQIGSFLTALRMKGETVAEITGAAKVMREKADKINVNNHLVSIDRDEINAEDETLLDIVGTGGDGTRTFNVSTTTAFVAAGAGLRVAKHGNRAVSSLCGSADVLENLGVNLDINHADVERCVEEVGIGFLYAPSFHGAMKYAAKPRREMGIRTLFNLLGPLTNPAGANVQVLGVYAPDLTEMMARVLGNLGVREAFVVCGEGTYDEISICGKTKVTHLKNGDINTFDMEPETYGFKRAAAEDIQGGNAKRNAEIVRDILDGEEGPKREMVLLNTASAYVASGLDTGFGEGIKRAIEVIDSGKAREKLDALVNFTQRCTDFVRKEL